MQDLELTVAADPFADFRVRGFPDKPSVLSGDSRGPHALGLSSTQPKHR